MPRAISRWLWESSVRIHLKELRQETTDVMSFIFDLGENPFTYRPGQYVSYELEMNCRGDS